jgi:uncharacterized protein YoxC
MPVTLEVVLVIAAIAFTVLTVCLIPLALLAWRQLARLAVALEVVRADVDLLLRDSHELARNVIGLSTRANQQMDDVGKVVHTAELWTERADALATRVGAAIEPPVTALTRNAVILRAGVDAFLWVLAHRSRQKETGKEKDNVRR